MSFLSHPHYPSKKHTTIPRSAPTLPKPHYHSRFSYCNRLCVLIRFAFELSHPLFVGRGACPSRCTEPLHSHNHCKRTTIPRKSPPPLPYERFVSFAKRSKPPSLLPPLSKVRCCCPKKFGQLPEGLLYTTNPSKTALSLASHHHPCLLMNALLALRPLQSWSFAVGASLPRQSFVSLHHATIKCD